MKNSLEAYKKKFKQEQPQVTSLQEWLNAATSDESLYASPADRMLKAIGTPKIVNTNKDPRLSRIFGNREIEVYEAFEHFYGLEAEIQQIVSFFKHASQNLEESRQILYLLGPVGSSKSSLVECLKKLMEREYVYILADKEGNLSPIYESPLGIIPEQVTTEMSLPSSRTIPSPWATKRLEEYNGDLSLFKVVRCKPNQLKQICITKTEPGDDNNQDISALVGKIDIRKLEKLAQHDPDAYSYSGGLCLSNQGILDFVEMFKAPIKMLHPLLTATQEKNYKGTEALAAIPYDGIVVAHSNESEWTTFKQNKNNEAFLDRVYIVEVPYCLRVEEEIKIYKKLLSNSKLNDAPIAPNTLQMLAEFCILTRLEDPENSNIYSKMKVYNGENIKEKDVHAKSYQEYKDDADADEGFYGISTRLAYKILAEVFNFDSSEIAADPVHLLYVLEKTIERQRFSEDIEEEYLDYLKDYLSQSFLKKVEKDIQTAYLDSYGEFGQSLFDRYILFADHWIQDNNYRDPDTNQMFDRELLNRELERIEKPAEISNPKDFRHEIVNFALRYRAQNKGNNPDWTAYEKLRKVIEHNMFSKTKDLLPVISFSGQGNKDDKSKHDSFVNRMKELGYTEKQVRRVVEWHTRASKA